MDANEREYINDLVHAVVGAVYEVSNSLGPGFLEKVYERALLRELALRGVRVQSQATFSIVYKGQHVGDYIADLLIDGKLLVELKCVECFSSEHMAQCLNYLKASGLPLCLLVNFQKPRAEWKRIVLDF